MTTGQDVVNWAQTQLGKPYVFGAHGPNSYDCSGLVEAAYRQFGLRTPGNTASMIGSGSNLIPIGASDARPGDLLFFSGQGRPIGHVAILAGPGKIVEAPHKGANVRLSTYNPSSVKAYRRVPGLSDSPSAPRAADGNFLGGVAAGIASWIPSPSNLTEAVTNIGNAMTSTAEAAVGVGKVANAITTAFLPSNIMRLAAFTFGTMFILVGIWFLAREVKESA